MADYWTQKADFGGVGRYGAVGFSINTKGYIGTGYDGSLLNDFWEYNQDDGTWTQKADYSGGNVGYAVGFSIGSKGYIGTGWTGARVKDFYEYNPDNNTWTQKADYGGNGTAHATGFSIGSKGYIGTGWEDELAETNKFWEYNQDDNTWTQKADVSYSSSYATGFSIGSKGYICTGRKGAIRVKDFYEYNPSNNTWTQKTDFPGTGRGFATSFSILARGFVGLGFDTDFIELKDFFEYNQDDGTWVEITNFNSARKGPASFSIGLKGYTGTGGSAKYNDFYEWCCGAPSTYTISGNVKDYNGNNVEGATITFTDTTTYSTTTDSSGNYTKDISPDIYDISAYKHGYPIETASIDASASDQTQNFVLRCTPRKIMPFFGPGKRPLTGRGPLSDTRTPSPPSGRLKGTLC